MSAIQEALNRYGDGRVDLIKSNLLKTGSNASGETSKSIKRQNRKELSVQVVGKEFVYVVETGRKAGKMPPVSKILAWLKTGKSGLPATFGQAFGISKKIGKEGSALFRKGGRKDIITPALNDNSVNLLTSEIADITLDMTVKSIENGTKR